MKGKFKILMLWLSLLLGTTQAAAAIVTTAGTGSVCPENEVVIPITVSNCDGVTAISLALNYDNTKIAYQGFQNVNSQVASMLVNQSNGRVYITWANLNAVNLGNATLLELRFTGISGTSSLTWQTNLCEYSNAEGSAIQSTYTNGSVTVYGVPNITSNPVDRNIAEGQNTYFEVNATGQGLSYQWQLKAATSNEWQNLSNGGNYSSVTTRRLNVNNVSMDMNGNQYRCTVSGTCLPPVTSEAATLSVQVFVPTIVTSIGSAVACADQVFSVPVTVTNCSNVGAISLALNYNQSLVAFVGYENANTGLSNGSMRVNANNGVVYFTWVSSNQTLEIGNGELISLVFKSASGNSSLSWNTSLCEYSNRYGAAIPSSYMGGNLNVYFPPSISANPTDKTAMEGSNTNFSITASGDGLSYQWQMSQDQGVSWETLSNGGHYSNVTNRTLSVNNVVASMDGYRFRCQVSGTCDLSLTSNYATLHVNTYVPTIVTTAGSLNTCSEIEFGIPVTVTNCNNVGAISLTLSYNTNVLTYIGYEGVNPELADGFLQVNAYNGMVFIAWASSPGSSANVGNGNLITIRFSALSGTSGMNWHTAYCEYANATGVAIPASYNNGNVTVGDLSFTITSQPANQTITMEESTTFTIATEGPTTGFQWQVSQDGGASWSNISAGGHYTNPSTNTLGINNVPIDMNGYRYRCVVSGSCGVQYSSSGLLTVSLPPNYYEITLSADPEEGGTTEGAGAYLENTSCTVMAIPATGYNFVNWTENGIEVSQELSYTFAVTGHRDLVAHFTLQEITINVSANPIGGGTINGGGTYLYGEHVLLTAIPITGSVFDNWTEDDVVISTNQSISFTAQTDRTLVANFSVQQINIIATPVPANNGTIEGTGTYAYGSMVTLVAHAGQGFEFSNWVENGEVVSTSDTLSFMAENDRSFEANFITQTLNITAMVEPEIGGSVTGAGVYNYGDPVMLTAIPQGVFEFLNWTENGVEVSTEPTYTFTAHSDRNLVAHFFTTITITATVQPEGSGTVSGEGTYNYADPVTLTALPNTGYSFVNWTENDTVFSTGTSINFTAYANRNFVAHFDPIMHHITVSANIETAGTVTGEGDYQEGSQATVSAYPNAGYEFVCWKENGITVSAYQNYTFTIWEPHNLVAEFQLISYTITAIANPLEGGSVTGTGTFLEGDTCSLTASPNQGYLFENWTKQGDVVSDSTVYSFLVTEDATFVANFAELPVLDTTLYAEICDGENYLQNGFEIYWPSVGIHEYSMTLQSVMGYDSIVNLALIVNPVYFFSEDTTLCNTSSFTWRGHTYTESGIYYDSLQTVHGCDSIYQLSLNLFNTPLGEFTYMTPTNNYPFTSLPITFSWDAVIGAQYYDLYVWEENDPMPNAPFVSNLTSRNYSTTALSNYHTYNWYVTARNTCYETSSSMKSFYLDITPSLSVNLNQIDFGEVAMNQSTSTTLNVTGIVLEDEINVEITGADASLFSYTNASGWNSYNGGILIVSFNPTTPQYSYNANLVVSSGTITKTVSLTGAVSNLYTFNTYVAEDVYAMNCQIPIYGSVTDWNNAPVADAEVEIGVFVMGMKRTLQAITNASGQFSAVFEPMPSESGYYTVNSGRVGNNNTAVHDDFNIPGMALVSSDYILCAVTQDLPKTDSILIRNKSNLPLNNIQLSILSAPDGCTFSSSPMSLGGLEEDYLVFTVTGSILTQGNYYEEVRLKATSSEGAETVVSVWYYCMEPRGVLDVMPKSLATTMTKGKSKIVDVMLTNNGTAATGNITIDLPDVEWMSVVGNDTLPSLAVNDTAYFSLRFSPDNEIPLVQYSGTIAINSERGDAIGLPYTITAVADSTGTLVIDVTDDYTWNTNNGNGPHLEGAEVTLKGYYSLETVAHGFTDANGIFQVDDLPEGYYRLSVTAERHSDYNSVVFVEAGATDRSHTDVYLQYQAITYSWIVEPTEIPDEYTYELDVVFETHVPVPVITIEHSGIHDLEYGESASFNLIITNHGLISAFDTHIYFSESSEYTFVPLYDVIDTLSALTTVVIPGTYYRTSNRMKSSDGDCDVHCMTISIYYCNLNGSWTSLIQGRSLPFGLGNYEICRPEGGGVGWGGFAHLNTNIAFPSGIEIVDPDGPQIEVPIETEKESCTPCIDALVDATGDIVSDYVPGGCYVTSAVSDIIKAVIHYDSFNLKTLIKDILNDEVGCGIDAIIDPILNDLTGGLSGLISSLRDIYNYLSGCVSIDIQDMVMHYSRANMDNIQNTINGLYYSTLYFSNELVFIKSYFPEEVWETEENISEFFSQFRSLIDSETALVSNVAAENFASTFVGTSVTYEDIINFVNRWNRSVEYWSNNYFVISALPDGYDTDFIQIDTVIVNDMLAVENYFVSNGYESVQELYEESIQNAMIIANNASQSSICASVKVRFPQNMTMTREAFEGTFTVHNGHDSEPMEAIGLEFIIKDEDGNVCNNLFQINTLLLKNLTEIDGSGSLDASLDGIAKIQFIPTKYAAPTEPKVYYFGGTFSFIDPYTLDEIVYDLYPVEITVNPSPDLYVDYFMQRDILGDDALTEDVIEPSVPAELGVIINNKGAGIAKNVTLETAEPQIIDNEKGLAVDFAMYGASFNGSPRQLGLMGISFGNIGSGQTAVGEWLFTSSLLGHFVSYEAHVIHNSSYGNSDLSLVSHLDIHELIHPIYAYGNLDDGINDFLVNDNPDAYDMPDTIYFSHGGMTSVSVADEIGFDHLVSPSDTIVTLTVVPSRIGWNYGVTDDPGMNQYNIVSCIRNNDNQVIPLNNVWQTFVTIPDGGDPVYENKLHIVDTIPVQQTTTYTLAFSKKPSNLRIFNGNVNAYWSNAENWEGNIIPQVDDEVLINGICLLDEDVEVFSLTVAENQSLTIPDGRILTVSGQLTSASVSKLIIEEGGQLMHGNEGVQATVKKNIEPYTNNDNGWYLIASPLAGLTTVASVANMLSNEYDLYEYDEPTAYWINHEYAANGFSELVNGKGYLYANSEGVVLEFPGTLRSGNTTVTVPLIYTEGTDLKGFNLVGNPFVYNLTAYASTNVADGCFRMNETRDDLIVSEVSETNPLKPAEGFFVKAIGEGASITFNPQMSNMAPEGSIRVELSENNLLIDRLIVKTNEAKSLKKFSLNETRTKLFAQDNRHEWALVPCASNEQPVSFKAAKNGTYTINVKADGMEFYYLHLIDNLTGNDVDLLAEASYTFDARTTDYASRFLLRFIPKDSPSTDSGTEHFAYCFNDKWIITNEGDATLQVMDVLGHILSNERINGTCEKQLSTSAGVYLLRLINGNDVKVQKIVVR